MRHQDLTLNHRLESWVYANAAARTGATGFVSGDIGRIAYQTDTGSYWRLLATTPTWAAIVIVPADAVASVFGRTGAVVAAANDYSYAQLSAKPVYASLQTAATNAPGATATLIMAAVGGQITPSASGKLLVTFCGFWSNTVTNGACGAQIRYGTGTRPAHGAAATGTPVGTLIGRQGSTGNFSEAVSISVLITGLTSGTQYWLDLSYSNGGSSGTCLLGSIVCSAVELP